MLDRVSVAFVYFVSTNLPYLKHKCLVTASNVQDYGPGRISSPVSPFFLKTSALGLAFPFKVVDTSAA
jgi:hypothetical protein